MANCYKKTLPVNNNLAVRNLVRRLCSIPDKYDAYWSIIDEVNDDEGGSPVHLVMIHYTNNSPKSHLSSDEEFMKTILPLRGQVVDVEKECLHVPSTGHILTYEVAGPITSGEQFSVPILSSTGSISTKELYFPASSKIYPGFEATNVRTYLVGDEFFFSTRTKLRAFNSYWGNSMTFYEFFKSKVDVGILKEKLKKIPFLSFLLVQPGVNLCSLVKESSQVYQVQENEGSDEIIPGAVPFNSISHTLANQFLFPEEVGAKRMDQNEEDLVPGLISLNLQEETVSYHPGISSSDPRLMAGEFLVVKLPNCQFIRLNSPRYSYSLSIIGNDCNLYRSFFNMAKTIINFGYGGMEKSLGFIPPVIDEYPLSKIIMNDDVSKDECLKYWFFIFKMAAGKERKEEVDDFYNRFHNDISRLANFIINDFPKWRSQFDSVVKSRNDKPLVSDKSVSQFQHLYNLVAEKGSKENKVKLLKVHLRHVESSESVYKLVTVNRLIDQFFSKLEQ